MFNTTDAKLFIWEKVSISSTVIVKRTNLLTTNIHIVTQDSDNYFREKIGLEFPVKLETWLLITRTGYVK